MSPSIVGVYGAAGRPDGELLWDVCEQPFLDAAAPPFVLFARLSFNAEFATAVPIFIYANKNSKAIHFGPIDRSRF